MQYEQAAMQQQMLAMGLQPPMPPSPPMQPPQQQSQPHYAPQIMPQMAMPMQMAAAPQQVMGAQWGAWQNAQHMGAAPQHTIAVGAPVGTPMMAPHMGQPTM